MRKLLFLLFSFLPLFASDEKIPDLTMTPIGFIVLAVFVVCYFFIASEERFELDKSAPALFAGIVGFLAIAVYYYVNGLDITLVHKESESVILEIAEIFFFLFVAMTYIETLIMLGVFDRLKYNLIMKGYTYKQLFWVTGILAFFLSPIADNLTTALILSTVAITIDNKNKNFLVPTAINIVVAANAGGAWSPFGDITTLMTWTNGKGEFIDFLYLFPATVCGYLLTAYLLSLFVPKNKPSFDAKEKKPPLVAGSNMVIVLGFVTLVCAVISHQVLDFPAMWGMMFGLLLLEIYSYRLKKRYGPAHYSVFRAMERIENKTLLFFFGILAAVGALYFVGWLTLLTDLYKPSLLGPTVSNIGIGFLSAIVDNVPVMSAVLKANPEMDTAQWMLVALTAGIGGSLISFGSAAGVGVMGKMQGIYTFSSHLKYAWTVLLGYILSISIWYVQFEIMGIF